MAALAGSAKHALRQDQVSGGGDGQVLGDALDDAGVSQVVMAGYLRRWPIPERLTSSLWAIT